jgi:DNA replication protein DnaC
MTDDIEQLLKNMGLRRMLEILDRELERATNEEPSYEAFLARLLREEYQHQQERSIEARIKRAKIPEMFVLETFPFAKQPGVRKSTIQQLATLDFVSTATNVIFIGETGVGKSGLATGLLVKALQNGHRGLFIRAQDLFDDLYTSLADRSSRSLITKLTNIDVLLIDELGYINIRSEQSNIFFKLIEERYRHKPTLITSSLDFDDWYGFLGNKKMVEALLSRLRQYCHTIRIAGPCLREPTG